ncbi:E3 ubiquitin-protein ligase RNF113A-like [Petaurus breviceps papuanus]|uniref:E3 ubiquitin-protein ligase RNF113A-like n=1 Tax=Petaurus breviceps papuanus TaxID=3040969 RepID=UPI0036DA509A
MAEEAPSSSPAPSGPLCPFLFRKSGCPRPPGRRRRRGAEEGQPDDDSSSDEGPAAIRPEKKRATPNPMIQRSGGGAGRREDEAHASALAVLYPSSRSAKPAGPEDMGATAGYELDAAHEPQPQGGPARKGPVRAPVHLRATVRWDYQPDVCKDYKETGFCGFGHSCKFLHDRSDYKHGWQLEREDRGGPDGAPDAAAYEVSADGERGRASSFCPVCRGPFRSPVAAPCGHCLCRACALSHFRTSPRCCVCERPTHGVFNPARGLGTQPERRHGSAAEETPDGATSSA